MQSSHEPEDQLGLLLDYLSLLGTTLKEIAKRLPSDPDELLTAEQLAGLFQLSARTVKDQASAGVIAHHRFGKHYRFSRADVASILMQFQHEPQIRRRPRLAA